MGLNSLKLYLYMPFKYHIGEININKINIKNINENIVTKKKENLFLCNNGLCKIVDNDVYLYKLIDKDAEIYDNYLDKYTLYLSNSYWKSRKVNNIPYSHKTIEITYVEVKLSEYSKNSMIIEIFNGKIIDLYFISNATKEDFSLKEDISLFIEMIM